MYIVALNGSPNKDGNTAFLLKEILRHCEGLGAQTQLINVHEAMMSAKWPFCTACSTPCSQICFKDTLLEDSFKALKRADALVIGSPVYFGSMSGQLKAFFDKSRALRGEKALIGKPAVAVSVGASKYGGQETTVKAIHDTMLVQGMTIVNDGHADFDAGHHGALAQRPAQTDEAALKRLEIVAKRIFSAARAYEVFR